MKMIATLAILATASVAMAGLVDTRNGPGGGAHALNGALGANEYGSGNSQSYGGSGTGFGVVIGGSNAQMYIDSDATKLYVGIQVGNNLNDNIVMYMNTSNFGGFTSSTQMDDSSDPGRGRSSDPMSGGTVNLPFAAQYSFVVGSFGAVLFELSGNGTAHVFKSFDGTFTGNGTGFREYALNLSDLGGALGSRSYIDFLALYTSDSGFMSNESICGQGPLNLGGNPGFDNGGAPLDLPNFDRYTIPTPGSLGLMGLASLAAVRRRR